MLFCNTTARVSPAPACKDISQKEMRLIRAQGEGEKAGCWVFWGALIDSVKSLGLLPVRSSARGNGNPSRGKHPWASSSRGRGNPEAWLEFPVECGVWPQAAQLLHPIIPAAGTLWELLALLPISPLAFDGLQKSLCGTRMLLGCFCPKLLCCVSQKLHGSGEKSLRREERALGSSSVLV